MNKRPTNADELHEVLRDLVAAYTAPRVATALNDIEPRASRLDTQTANMLAALINLIEDPIRPSMRLECLRIACGFSAESYAHLATRCGVSKNAVHLHIKSFRIALGLPPCGKILTNQERARYAGNGKKAAKSAP